MRHAVLRTLGSLTVAAALVTGTTAAFASAPDALLGVQAAKKRVTTLAGLSTSLRTSAIQRAQTRPGATKVGNSGGTSQDCNLCDDEVELLCNHDWFVTFDEDANGYGVVGTYYLHCDGVAIPIG